MQRRYDQIINRDARVDWRAAILAGLIGGGIMWLLSHGIPWFTSGMVSPTLMGRDLKPPGLIDPFRSIVTVLAQGVVCVVYSLVIAPLVTRFRGMWAVALGSVLGLGLYLLNFFAFHFLTAIDWTGTELPVLVTHIVFGSIVAAAYKGLAARRFAGQPRSETA